MLLKSKRIHQKDLWKHWMEVFMINYQIERTHLSERMKIVNWWTRLKNRENMRKCLLSPIHSWVFIIFLNKLIISMPRMIKIQSSSLLKIMETIPACFTLSKRRKEKILIVIFLERSKDYCQESNKMLTKKWWNNLRIWKRTMSPFEEIWILIFTKIRS